MILTQLQSPALVLGGAYSGKSDLATQLLAPDTAAAVIGTAPPDEPAFAARLAQLRATRPPAWETFAAGRDLAAAVEAAAKQFPQILIDSLSQWLAAVLVGGGPVREEVLVDLVVTQVDEVLRIMGRQDDVRFVVVSAEVGHGPAPGRGLERLYRQQLGLANQRLARAARSVLLVTAGLPTLLKS